MSAYDSFFIPYNTHKESQHASLHVPKTRSLSVSTCSPILALEENRQAHNVLVKKSFFPGTLQGACT